MESGRINFYYSVGKTIEVERNSTGVCIDRIVYGIRWMATGKIKETDGAIKNSGMADLPHTFGKGSCTYVFVFHKEMMHSNFCSTYGLQSNFSLTPFSSLKSYV